MTHLHIDWQRGAQLMKSEHVFVSQQGEPKGKNNNRSSFSEAPNTWIRGKGLTEFIGRPLLTDWGISSGVPSRESQRILNSFTHPPPCRPPYPASLFHPPKWSILVRIFKNIPKEVRMSWRSPVTLFQKLTPKGHRSFNWGQHGATSNGGNILDRLSFDPHLLPITTDTFNYFKPSNAPPLLRPSNIPKHGRTSALVWSTKKQVRIRPLLYWSSWLLNKFDVCACIWRGSVNESSSNYTAFNGT